MRAFLANYWQAVVFVLTLTVIVSGILVSSYNQSVYERGLSAEGFIQINHKGRLLWIKPADIPKLLEIEVR